MILKKVTLRFHPVTRRNDTTPPDPQLAQANRLRRTQRLLAMSNLRETCMKDQKKDEERFRKLTTLHHLTLNVYAENLYSVYAYGRKRTHPQTKSASYIHVHVLRPGFLLDTTFNDTAGSEASSPCSFAEVDVQKKTVWFLSHFSPYFLETILFFHVFFKQHFQQQYVPPWHLWPGCPPRNKTDRHIPSSSHRSLQ